MVVPVAKDLIIPEICLFKKSGNVVSETVALDLGLLQNFSSTKIACSDSSVSSSLDIKSIAENAPVIFTDAIFVSTI